MEVRLENKLEGIAKFVREGAARVVDETAHRIAAEAQASMKAPKSGQMYGEHRASAPGEAPAVWTGELLRSISTERVGEGEAQVVVGAEHATMLEYGTVEMAARPFLTPAAERVRPTFEQGIKELWDE